jgi:hypothetical protein
MWLRAQFEGQLSQQGPSPAGEGIKAASASSPSTAHSARAEEPKTRADRAIAQLLSFERLDADWDGNQAAKPLAFSIRYAREFIRALAPESVIPRPALHADGHVILFERGANSYSELEFLEGRRIGFYARRGSQEWNEEFVFDGRTIPGGLLRAGFAI